MPRKVYYKLLWRTSPIRTLTGSELDEKQEARIIALACRKPPAGQARWTLELLTQEVLKDGIVTHLSPETVRLLLKKTNSNPGK